MINATKKLIKSPWIYLICLLGIGGAIVLYRNNLKSRDFDERPISAETKAVKSPSEQPITNRPYFFSLPIHSFSRANIPIIEVSIENQKILARLDLGAEQGLCLPESILSKIEKKKFTKKHTFFGLRGKTYLSNEYEISKMKMGPVSIFPMKITEENQEFADDAVLKKGPVEILEPFLGTIGRLVFEKLNLFLDCQQKMVAICDSLETLQSHGYFKHSFIQTPILSNRGSIDFEAFSAKGTLRCILDTGCTKNLIKSQYNQPSETKIDLDSKGNHPTKKFNASNADLFAFEDKEELSLPLFQIETKEFGPMNFLQMRCPMNIEAIIGMDFISTHAIFIDFKKGLLYIEESPKNPL